MRREKQSAGELDARTRKAFKAAFNAMEDWRDEVEDASKRYGEEVFDRLASAAREAGWQDSLIEATRSQLMQAARMQSDMIDHMLEAWRTQIDRPLSPAEFLGALGERTADEAEPPPARDAAREERPRPGLDNPALAPAQMWMQATAMWQRSWSDAMRIWMGGRPFEHQQRDWR